MGNHAAGREIVERAISLWLSRPEMPPIKLLDQAVEGNEGTDAEFESIDPSNHDYVHPLYHDERFLPSPFAEILRRAFAPDLDPREMLFATQPDNDNSGIQKRIEEALDTWYKRVIDPFTARYSLG